MLEHAVLHIALLLTSAPSDKKMTEVFGNWQSTGRTCSEWSPDASDQKADVVIVQTRECKTTMARKVFVGNDGAGTNSGFAPRDTETRVETSRQERVVRGKIDDVIAIKKQRDFGPWVPKNLQKCDELPLIANSVADRQIFFTAQKCQAELFRQKKAVEVFRSGKTMTRPDLTETEHRRGVYTMVLSHHGEQETWFDDGFRKTDPKIARRTCAAFHIEPDWTWGLAVSFPISCQEEWSFDVQYMQRNQAGKRRIHRTETQQELRKVPDTFPLWGAKDQVASESFRYSDWALKGPNCFEQDRFISKAALLPWGTQFIEVARCHVTMQREKSRVRTYASGEVDTVFSETEHKNVMRTDTRHAIGGVDRRLHINEVRYSKWLPEGSKQCTGWLPHPTAISQQTSFIQTNRCHQTMSRDAVRLETWLSGPQEFQLEPESMVYHEVDVRNEIGVGLIAITESVFPLSEPRRSGVVNIPEKSRRVRITVSLSTPFPDTLQILFGHAQLELPALPAGGSQFYFDINDFKIPTGQQTIQIGALPQQAGSVSISFD